MGRVTLLSFLEKNTAVAKTSMKERERENDDIKDDIIRDYNSIIRESALLTTVYAFLFGFLLNISINTQRFWRYR